MIPHQIAGLELRHRQHARVEDRIREGKAAGISLWCAVKHSAPAGCVVVEAAVKHRAAGTPPTRLGGVA